MALIGYARVSSDSQKTDRQMDSLEAISCSKIFSEEISGIVKNRPALMKMLDYVREGDTLVVESISRLGRSTIDLLNIVEQLQVKGVHLKSLKESCFLSSIFPSIALWKSNPLPKRQSIGISDAIYWNSSRRCPEILLPISA